MKLMIEKVEFDIAFDESTEGIEVTSIKLGGVELLDVFDCLGALDNLDELIYDRYLGN